MKQITPFSISAPGFFGLNQSDSPSDLSPNYALQADNCIIDRSGRIASRKGWTAEHTTNADLGTANITCIAELIQNDGTATTLVTGNGCLFKHSGTTLTKLTYGGGGVAPTISANNWMFTQLNGVGIFWQRGYDPLIYDPVVSTTTFRRLSERSGYLGTVLLANVAISEFGRVWCADTSSDKNTVKFSDLIAPHVWTGGTSGSIDLKNVWTGGDEVVAFAAHNKQLFIFGRKQILIYDGADDPTTMALSDKVVGIGCIARDSVQTTGDDVWFLSDTGVRSLSRTIQEKSAPIRQISKNVHDELQQYIDLSDLSNLKSGFSAVNSIYLLSIPAGQVTYCFDTRGVLESGAAKVTTWSCVYYAYCETKSRSFYLGKPGYVGKYSGYSDNGSSYRMSYYTTWIDFGNPVQTSILKKLLTTVICSTNQTIIFKWAYDFQSEYFSDTVTVTGGPTYAEYGTAEYGTAEYNAASQSINVVPVQGRGSGQVLKFGIEVQSNLSSVSIQKISIYTKDGRI
jgi:hypothetical protein